MTRESIIKELEENQEPSAMIAYITSIIDHFESRSCDSCMYINPDEHEPYCNLDITTFGDEMNWIENSDTFYCSKWEKKDDN